MAALYPRKRPGTHVTGGWVGPRAGLDERKISSPTGFDPGPVQPLVSRYTDWHTRPTLSITALSIRIHWSGRKLSSSKLSCNLFVVIPTVDSVNCAIQFNCHILTNSPIKSVSFCSLSLMVLWRLWLLGIATAVKCAWVMVVSSVTVRSVVIESRISCYVLYMP